MRSRSTSPATASRPVALKPPGGVSNATKALLVVVALVAYPVCFFWSLFVVYDELPEIQRGGAASGSQHASESSSCGGVVVFGHRAAVPPGTAELPNGPIAPGSAAAVAWLAEKGVCAYDVDCFHTADGALVVGHPTELAQRLNLPASSPADALRLADLRRADGGQTATVDEFLAAYASTPCFDAHAYTYYDAEPAAAPGFAAAEAAAASRLRLLFEPKGAAATAATLDAMAQQVRARGFPPGLVGVWVPTAALARRAALTGALTPLLAVKGHDGAPLPSAADAAAFAVVGPPVGHPQLAQMVGAAARRRGQRLFTWVVDDAAQLAAAKAAAADGIISNDPVAMQAALCGVV